MNKKIIISIVCVALVFLLSVVYYFWKYDNVVAFATEMYPLDNKHIYTIIKNKEVIGNNDKIDTPYGVAYVIIPKGGDSQPPSTNGRAIGKTDMDIKPYLNKEVYIQGDFYDGTPLLLSNQNIPEFLTTGKRAVLYVKSLQLVK